MSDDSNHPNYEEDWPYPTFSALGVDQGYIIEKSVVTAEELLTRFSGLEPFELALGINGKILARKFFVRLFYQLILECLRGLSIIQIRPIYRFDYF